MKSLRGGNVFTDGAAPQLSKAKPASRNPGLSHISRPDTVVYYYLLRSSKNFLGVNILR